MAMNKVFSVLRKHGSGNIRQFSFCVFFAVLLITSLSVIMFSPMVSESVGMSTMTLIIFCVAFIGCVAFVLYGSGLFLRFKSREFGVFLALGAPKAKLSRSLFREVYQIFAKAVLSGLVCGGIISYIVWELFNKFFIESPDTVYRVSATGYFVGLLFSIIVLCLVLIQAKKFIKQINVIDILNAGRMNEAVSPVSKRTGIIGAVLLLTGIVLGYGVPTFTGHVLGVVLPSIWSVTFVFSLIGIYRIMLYAVIYHKRGNNPGKYYKNLISYGTMKFQGQQTVYNMFVIALLIAAGLYACFYTPSLMSGLLVTPDDAEPDFVFSYDQTADGITEFEVAESAKQHGLSVQDYKTVTYLELIGSGYDRDLDSKGVIVSTYIEQFDFYQFISSSDYQFLTGLELNVEPGTYFVIVPPEYKDETWYKKDDLDCLITPKGEKINLEFAGITEYTSIMSNGIKKMVISDNDYRNAMEEITAEHVINQVAFNVDNTENAYEFSKQLYRLFVERSSDQMAVGKTYNPLEQARMDGDAWDGKIVLDEQDHTLSGEWKYYPYFRILKQSDDMQYYAIQFLLFLYVAFICMAAVTVIAYTRSIAVSLQNKKLFEDLKKLGANKQFLEDNIKKQLSKIYVLPAIIGVLLTVIFEISTLYGNDSQLTFAEINALGLDMAVVLVFLLYLYIIYRAALAKAKKIV